MTLKQTSEAPDAGIPENYEQVTMNYILMTPARNEQDTLPIAARSLLDQDHRPCLWLIVNDGSIDRTQEIIQALQSTNSWIINRALPRGPGGLGQHFAKVVHYGFTQLQAAAEERGIVYDLIGKIDADVFFNASCFSALIHEFEEDELLGIASPRLVFSPNLDHHDGPNRVAEPDMALSDHPTDGIRLYRRQCFEEIGEIQIVRAPETVAEAKAKMKGWKLRRFDHIHGGISRKAHSSTSLWSRWVIAGSEAHYLGYHPLLVLGRLCFEVVFGCPRYRFLAYAWGYLQSYLRHSHQIEDAEVLNYFRHRRLVEVIEQIHILTRKGGIHCARTSHGE